jgi:hypothetical protein
VFFEAEPGHLKGSLARMAAEGMETAMGPGVVEQLDGYVYWREHYNRFGKIPFQIHPDVLTSDEAIVAVFAHEMSELSQLREVFISSKGRMDAMDYAAQVATDRLGNFHDKAWDKADEAVLSMRKAKQR